MKTGLKRRHVTGVALAAALILCAAALPQCPLSYMIHSGRARNWLLCKADHQAILKAGREVLAQTAKGNIRYGYYDVRDGCLSNGFRLPQAIADLEPDKVLVLEQGYLRIVYGGGFDHFGVNVFPDAFKEPFPGFPRGNRKLIDDGLWYFDDQYKWPDYNKEIDDLLRKCGRG